MNVKELITVLSECDQDSFVVMSKDSEGNDFSPCYEASPDHYRADSTWYGEIAMSEEDYNEERRDYSDDSDTYAEYLSSNFVPAVVLWPTN